MTRDRAKFRPAGADQQAVIIEYCEADRDPMLLPSMLTAILVAYQNPAILSEQVEVATKGGGSTRETCAIDQASRHVTRDRARFRPAGADRQEVVPDVSKADRDPMLPAFHADGDIFMTYQIRPSIRASRGGHKGRGCTRRTNWKHVLVLTQLPSSTIVVGNDHDLVRQIAEAQVPELLSGHPAPIRSLKSNVRFGLGRVVASLRNPACH